MKVRTFTDYASHVIGYGSSGTGKSVNTRWIAEYFYDQGLKILDIYDEGRLENVFMHFPNKNPGMYDLFMTWCKQPFPFESEGFPVECFIPVSPGIPGKLPIIFKPFTIAFEDLSKQEFSILLGRLSAPQTELISLIWDNLGKQSFENFISTTQDFIADGRIKVNNNIVNVCDDRLGLSVLQKVDRLNKLGLISDRKNPLNLDLKKIMRDSGTISCFSFAFLSSPNVRHLLWGYLFRKIYTLRINQLYWQYPEMAIIHREIQNNAPARGKRSSLSFEGQGISLEFIKKIIAEPRDIKIRLVADSQDPMKIDSDVRKGFSTKYIFQIDLAVLNSLIQQFWLDQKTYVGIQYLGLGQFALKIKPQYVNPMNRKGIQFPCMNPPPRSWCKSPDDLFFKIWKEHGLEFSNWKFVKPQSIIRIKKITSEEKQEVVKLSTEKLYDYFGKMIQVVVEKNPGINIAEIAKDPLVKRMNWSRVYVYSIVERLLSTSPPGLKRVREGRSWRCFPP